MYLNWRLITSQYCSGFAKHSYESVIGVHVFPILSPPPMPLPISSSVTPSPPALNFSQHQGLFQWASSSSGGQSTGASASASVLPVNIQDSFPFQLTGLISLQFKGLSRVLSNTTNQKHQFFGIQPSLWSNSHIRTWLLEKHSFD